MERHWKSEFLLVNWEHINLRRLHKVCKSRVNEVFRFPNIKVPFATSRVIFCSILHLKRRGCTADGSKKHHFVCLQRFLFTSAVLHTLMSATWGCDDRILTSELLKSCMVVFFLLTEENRCKNMSFLDLLLWQTHYFHIFQLKLWRLRYQTRASC